MNPIYKSTWFKLLIGLIILLLAIISFLPHGVQYAIERWYTQHGADQVQIGNVDINLFTGKLSIYDLIASKNQQTLLQVDSAELELEWLPLFKQRALLSRLYLDGLQTDITHSENGQLTIAGIQPDNKGSSDGQWGLGIQAVAINNTQLTLVTQKQQYLLGINSIELDRIETWSVDESHIKFAGKINDAPVVLDGQFNAFAKNRIFEGMLNIESLDLQPVSLYTQNSIQSLSGTADLSAEFRVALTENNVMTLNTDSLLTLKKINLANQSMKIDSDQLRAKGKLNVSLSNKLVLDKLEYTGNLTTENTNVNYEDTYRYHHDNLNWEGQVNSNSKQEFIEARGSTNVNGIRVNDLVSFIELFKASHLAINEFSASSDLSIQSKNWQIDDLSTLLATKPADQTPLFQAKQTTIEQLSFASSKLAITTLTVNQALIDIDKQQDGRIKQLVLLKKNTSPSSEASKPAPQSDKPATTISIKTIELAPGSKIRFSDASVKPDFKTELAINKAIIKQLNSGDKDSSSDIDIQASIDQYSSIAIAGTVKPFSKQVGTDLKATMKNIALPPLSSYTASIIGYDMVSGQLDTDSTIKITEGKIDASNKLQINNLEIKSINNQRAEQLKSELNMPLESALSLLRDKNNDIKLNLPVSGDLSKPDFDISGVINKALGTALKKSSLTYLTLALQPYGSLIAIAKFAQSAANQVNLNPIEFTAGSATLNQSSQEYVGKLSNVLTERPDLRIKLCGFATRTDQTALTASQKNSAEKSPASISSANQTSSNALNTATLEKLASVRANVIKESLVNTHNIAASRLFICKPAIDKSEDAKPRVDITL